MRYGIEVIPFGTYSDPQAVVRLAQAAEVAGWEAIAIWDHLLMPYGAGDPWVTLAAVAQATSRLKLITAVSPLRGWLQPVEPFGALHIQRGYLGLHGDHPASAGAGQADYPRRGDRRDLGRHLRLLVYERRVGQRAGDGICRGRTAVPSAGRTAVSRP